MGETPTSPLYQMLPDGTVVTVQEPLSLRDWFAGQALAGFTLREFAGCPHHADIAARAYEIADAMLAERAKEDGR